MNKLTKCGGQPSLPNIVHVVLWPVSKAFVKSAQDEEKSKTMFDTIILELMHYFTTIRSKATLTFQDNRGAYAFC